MMTRILLLTVLATFLAQTSPIHAANFTAVQPLDSENTGIVTGLQGVATVHPPRHAEGHAVRAGERLHAADEIHLQAKSQVEVLWNRRAVFSLHGDSRMRLLEPSGRQTRVQLLGGTARFAYSYNEGHPADTLAIVMSDVSLIMRGGILEVESETLGQVIRVVEGQVSIELTSSPGKQVLLKAGQGMEVRTGTLNTPHPSKSAIQPALAAMEWHREAPLSVVQHLTRTHVQHALELEERLRHATDEDNPHEESKGAILSTSLGLPPGSFSASSGPGIAGSLNPSSSPTPMSPAIPLPAPVSPAPSVSNIGTLGPIQAGGINSASLLQNTLKNVLTVR